MAVMRTPPMIGSTIAIRIARMAITTSISISVKARAMEREAFVRAVCMFVVWVSAPLAAIWSCAGPVHPARVLSVRSHPEH